MFKRVFLFLLTNIMVIATLSIITTVLGLHNYLAANGIDYRALAIFCAIWGSAGAFISLLTSKWIAKKSMGLRIIDPKDTATQSREVLQLVYGLAKKSGLTTMPEVGIYDSPELNAFATGPTKKNSLVAMSTGLLQNMNSAEVEGVLGHEISHVANGDMVTMTLLQGIINSFALFLSRIIAYAASMALSRGEQSHGGTSGTYYMFAMLFDVLFTFLGSLVVAAFSRHREYRADKGGAKLAGKAKMIDALKRLQLAQSAREVEDKRAPSIAALKISHKGSWFRLFSTHPPIELRIARLMEMKIR